MSPAEKVLATRIKARAAVLRPDLSRQLLAAYELIRDSLTEAELARAISSGQFDALLDEILLNDGRDGPFRMLKLRVDRAVIDAGRMSANDLPPQLQGPFDAISEHVIRAAKDLDTRVIRGLASNVRETVRQHVLRGMEEGLNPRTIARGARQILDLAPSQEQAVANFRRMLEEGDSEALTRALRDKRFDSTLRKAFASGEALPAEKVDRMVAAYHKGMVAHNAETISRTVSLDAQRSGQRLAWQDAIDRGIVEPTNLKRKWVTVGDERVRPEHRAMNGETISFEGVYSNGEKVPGETAFNCRCIERVFIDREQRAAA